VRPANVNKDLASSAQFQRFLRFVSQHRNFTVEQELGRNLKAQLKASCGLLQKAGVFLHLHKLSPDRYSPTGLETTPAI
jgi:hypothetical protein